VLVEMAPSSNCSGDANAGVKELPTSRVISNALSVSLARSLAMPKSRSFTVPSASTKMFDGFRSR